MPPPRRLRVPHEVAALIRGLHPVLKRKVRAALEALIRNPREGKALRDELRGLRSYRVGRFRIIYRLRRDVELVAFGPRESIYVETYRQLHEPRGRYRLPGALRMQGTHHRFSPIPRPGARRRAVQSAAAAYASGGGQAHARWRSP